jgi:hypothetical protein
MSKKPKTNHYPKSPDKNPKINEPQNSLIEKPVWLINRIDFNGVFGWKNIEDREKFIKIIERLKSFESMTWAEIIGKENHLIPIYKLDKHAQKRLSEIKLDDIVELVSLRLSAVERIWGIKEKEKFKILWWDPEHKVYPVEKKNT